MAAIRLSPGVYQVNGKRINAASAAEAERIARGGKKPARPGPGGDPSDPRIIPRKTKIRGVSDAIEASEDVADVEAGKGLRYGNVTKQTGALGDSREIIYDDQGRPVEMRDRLSADQQGISDADMGISNAGRSAALGQLGSGAFGQSYRPDTAQRTVGGDLFGADRKRIEDSVFNNLTRNLQKDKAQEWGDQEQALADRGVAIDPRDPSYQKARENIDRRYDEVSANARDRATQIGGQELTNAFGMQEQGIANQFSQGWGNRQNQLGEVSNLANMGPGLRTGNFQGFQGVGYDIADPVATDLGYKADRRENRTAGAALSRLGGGSQGPQAPAAPESPFNAQQPSAPGPQMSASAPSQLAPQAAPAPQPAARAALSQLGAPSPAAAPAAAPGGNLQALQAKRAQILGEIQRRGGAAKAPGYATQLQQVDAQIRAARG